MLQLEKRQERGRGDLALVAVAFSQQALQFDICSLESATSIGLLKRTLSIDTE